MITFPECLEQLFQDCLDRINSEIAEIGLSTIEVVVHEKRNSDQDGYNKVVIVTNQLADGVKGRVGDGIVTYPFLWNDVVTGPRTLGVDGKWNCQNMTPDECCNSIKQSEFVEYGIGCLVLVLYFTLTHICFLSFFILTHLRCSPR